MSDEVSAEHVEICLKFCEGIPEEVLIHCNEQGGFDGLRKDHYLQQLGLTSLLLDLLDDLDRRNTILGSLLGPTFAVNAAHAHVDARDTIRTDLGLPDTRTEIAKKKAEIAALWLDEAKDVENIRKEREARQSPL